jgi:hypothetical protein
MSFLLLNGLQAERVDEVGDQRPSDYEDGQEHRRDEDDVAGGVLVVSVVEGVDRSSPWPPAAMMAMPKVSTSARVSATMRRARFVTAQVIVVAGSGESRGGSSASPNPSLTRYGKKGPIAAAKVR